MPRRNFKKAIAESPLIFTIGVAGDSGSGKTTFTSAVRSIFGKDLVSTISLDDYHRFDRNERLVRGITPLHPEANRLGELEQDLTTLKQGGAIKKPVYDHDRGTFAGPVSFRPTKIVILEGLHTLFTDTLRKNLDFTIFVEPDREVKYRWKIRRDVEQRGYQIGDVEREIREREPDYERFIAPQKEYADAVVRVRNTKYGKILQGSASHELFQVGVSQSRMRHVIEETELAFDLYSILSLSERNFLLEFVHADRNGRMMGDLIMDGEVSTHVVSGLERSIERQTGVRPIAPFTGKEYVNAIDLAQLILSWRIIHRRLFLESCS